MNLQRLIPPIDLMVGGWTADYSLHTGKPDCIIGFSFGFRGKPGKITPGLSNQDLANIALKHHADLPKIFQFEIADAYAEAEGKNADKIIRISQHRRPKHYLDTREVADQAKIIMKQHGWKKALLLAHPNHLPRVEAVCDRLGIEWVANTEEKGAVEFDPLSSQTWTRNLDQWRAYEPMAIMYYRLKGWL